MATDPERFLLPTSLASLSWKHKQASLEGLTQRGGQRSTEFSLIPLPSQRVGESQQPQGSAPPF